MDQNAMKQRRATFSEAGQGGRRESFKDKSSRNWFQKQFSSPKSYDYDSMDSEFTTSIAAATFAVTSLEEANSAAAQNLARKEGSFRLPSEPIPSRRLSRKDTKEAAAEASMRKQMGQDAKAPFYSSVRAKSPATGYEYNDRGLTRNGRTTSKVDDWEKAEMGKVQKRYEKSKITIQSWENERKMRAKSRMEAKKNELEQRRARNWQHYQSKLARIDHIAGGARKQVEEKRRNEEKMLKEKAKKMKSKGKSPTYWICC